MARGGRSKAGSTPAVSFKQNPTVVEAPMATAVDAAIVEIEAAILAIQPPLEGHRDFARLNLEGPARIAVEDAIEDYQRRLAFLQASLEALNDLVGDGYPALDVREIPAAAFADLQANAATIAAALAQFSNGGAVTLSTTSVVVPK